MLKRQEDDRVFENGSVPGLGIEPRLLTKNLSIPSFKDVRRGVPAGMFGLADGIPVDDDGGDVEEGELEVGHVDGAEVYVGSRDVKLTLVVESLALHFVG